MGAGAASLVMAGRGVGMADVFAGAIGFGKAGKDDATFGALF